MEESQHMLNSFDVNVALDRYDSNAWNRKFHNQYKFRSMVIYFVLYASVGYYKLLARHTTAAHRFLRNFSQQFYLLSEFLL